MSPVVVPCGSSRPTSAPPQGRQGRPGHRALSGRRRPAVARVNRPARADRHRRSRPARLAPGRRSASASGCHRSRKPGAWACDRVPATKDAVDALDALDDLGKRVSDVDRDESAARSAPPRTPGCRGSSRPGSPTRLSGRPRPASTGRGHSNARPSAVVVTPGRAGCRGECDDGHQRSRESRTSATLPVATRAARTVASAWGTSRSTMSWPVSSSTWHADDLGLAERRHARGHLRTLAGVTTTRTWSPVCSAKPGAWPG